MKIKKSNLIFLVLALVLSLSIVGCTNDPNDTGMNNRDRLSTQTRINNRWDNKANDNWNRDNVGMRDDLNNGMTRPKNLNNKMDNSKNLAKDISNIPEVSKASVVVNDDTALVGVNLRGKTQNTMTNTLRRKIEKMVKDKNNDIKNVSITTDPDIYTRINNISTSINNGNPVGDFTDEIGDLFKRMGRGINNMTN